MVSFLSGIFFYKYNVIVFPALDTLLELSEVVPPTVVILYEELLASNMYPIMYDCELEIYVKYLVDCDYCS